MPAVLFPMVHFTEEKETLKRRLHQHTTLLDDKELGTDWHLHQGKNTFPLVKDF